ncbi:MAG: tRNA pseudouridine(38-40) synthase TruA, partial [Acidimicrobiales bacterium]
PVPDPFLAPTTWHVPAPLELRSMQAACDPLIGEHDFAAFCRRARGEGDQSLVRRVLDARWSDAGDGLLEFHIGARSFCHQMVRSVVGLHVSVGLGRRRAGDVAAILRAGDRQQAGSPAPAHGLCLLEVRY